MEESFRTYDPKRYRIVKITPPGLKSYYIVQKKFLWWWLDWVKNDSIRNWTATFPSFDTAKDALLKNIDQQGKVKREVILDRKG